MEGNDVSSGLKWNLLSNSVVLMPKPTRTSWAMEEFEVVGAEPWVHYIPMHADGSNTEEICCEDLARTFFFSGLVGAANDAVFHFVLTGTFASHFLS